MNIDQQIEMMKLIRETNEGEAKVWLKMGDTDTASVCVNYAQACTAVIGSLERLKKLEGK
jgi:hypothetical protein